MFNRGFPVCAGIVMLTHGDAWLDGRRSLRHSWQHMNSEAGFLRRGTTNEIWFMWITSEHQGARYTATPESCKAFSPEHKVLGAGPRCSFHRAELGSHEVISWLEGERLFLSLTAVLNLWGPAPLVGLGVLFSAPRSHVKLRTTSYNNTFLGGVKSCDAVGTPRRFCASLCMVFDDTKVRWP